MKWNIEQRTLDERSQREFRHATLRTPLRHRIDIVLITGLLVVGVILVGGWAAFVTIGDRLGWFDAPVMQVLADERILTNVRDDLPTKMLLDAVIHVPDENVYISQTGGTIHSYNPRTRLWSTERPFDTEDPVDDDFVMLRSGCGADLYSNNATECPDEQSLWAVGADGSLARRVRGQWEIVLDNTAFIGANGAPVMQDELTTAAVSEDNEWLLLGTRDNGIGLYALEDRTWLTVPRSVQQALPALAITHLVWWEDNFWIGTPSGLTRAEIGRNELQLAANPLTSGVILDLDADPDDALWVLEERNCITDGEKCLWLGQWNRSNGAPHAVIDQQNHYPDLTLNTLQFAQISDDQLILAGQSGIYRYDNQRHTWKRLLADPVIATLPLDDGTGFYFAKAGGVGLVDNAQLVEEWPFNNGAIIKLLHGRRDEILAFTDAGNLYAVSAASGETEPVYEGGETAFDPALLTSAAPIQDTILFIGPEGAMLHNTRTRTYEDVPADTVPAWLTQPGTRLFDVGDAVYVVSPLSGSVTEVRVLPAVEMASRSFFVSGFIDEAQPQTVPGPVDRIWRWGDDGIGIIGGDGSVYRFAAENREQLTGSIQSELDHAVLRDVVQTEDTALFVVNETLRQYNLIDRAWSDFPDPTRDWDEVVTALALFDEQLLLRTDRGRLLLEDGTALIGDETGIAISDAALSDVWAVDDQTLFLAGNGRVEQYSFDAREIVKVWQATDGGDVVLKAIINDLPLTHIGRQAALGDAIVDPDAGDVVTISADSDSVWTVRRDSTTSYVKSYDANLQNARCLFRSPTAGFNDVYDATELPNGLIAVAGNGSVEFYNPQARSWYQSQTDLRADRLYRLQDSHLLLVRGEETGNDFELVFLPLNWNMPDSCSINPLPTQPGTTIAASAVTVNEQAGRVAWITPDGAVIEWIDGVQTTIFDAAGSPPDQASLRRMYDYSAENFLLFTTDSELWRYDLGLRTWSSVALRFPGSVGPLREINIEQQGSTNTVTAQSSDGDLYLGTWSPTQDAVAMEHIYAADGVTFGASATALLDVQVRGDTPDIWTFVLRDRIKYYDPDNRNWRDVELDTDDGTRSFQEALGRGVVVNDNGNQWLIANVAGDEPNTFATYVLDGSDQARALDGNGHVWRLTAAGEVQQCTPARTTYSCSVTRIPFLLNANDVIRAYEWGGHVLFESATGLRALVVASGTERELNSAEAQFDDISAAFTYQGRLLFYSDVNNAILVFDSQLNAEQYTAVSNLIRDDAGRPWAHFNDGWRQLNGSSFARPSGAANVTLFAHNATTVTGIDTNRIPYTWSGSQLSAGVLPLPDAIDPAAVELLVRADADWWVLNNGQWVLAQSSTCYRPGTTPSEIDAPTPTPEPYACLQQTTPTPVIPDTVAAADWQDGVLTVTYADGRVLTLSADESGVITIAQRDDSAAIPTLPLDDQWAQLRTNLVTLPNGQTAYDPVVALRANPALNAVRYSGTSHQLALTGIVPTDPAHPFTLPPALDVGWLSWDRATDSFVVVTDSGAQRFSRQAFIVDEQLLFEAATSVLARTPEELYLTNPHGIWRYPDAGLSLNENLVYYPDDLPDDITAAHDQFIIGTQAIAVRRSGLSRGTLTDVTITVGDAIVTEQVDSRTVAATVAIDGNREDAFVGAGFVWDANRRGVAYEGVDLLLQSDAGVHPVVPFLTDFTATPDELGRSSGILQSNGKGDIYLYVSAENQWLRRDSQRWSADAVNPHHNRQLVNNGIWEWVLSNDNLIITIDGVSHAFAVVAGDFGFASDQLRAAAAWGNERFVATDAFLERGTQFSDFYNLGASRFAPIVSDRLETWHFADGSVQLFNYTDNAIQQWDASGNQFVPFAGPGDPELSRDLVAHDRLRFSLVDGEIAKDVRLDRPGGGSTWAAFTFFEGQFPFDYVTAISAFNDMLYVGTAAGLSAHPNPATTRWSDLTALIDMRPVANSNDLASVRDVGVPEANTNLLMARSDQQCIKRMSNSNFSVCNDASLLDRRLRVQTPFWQWLVADEQLVGQYSRADGQLDSTEIQITQGRWPHDRVADAIVCDGRAITLWDERWTSVHDADETGLHHAVDNYPFENQALKRLICLQRDFPLDDVTVQSGAYLESEDGQLWQFGAVGWRTVNATDVATGVISLADNPPVFYRTRVRLLQPQSAESGFVFEQRDLSGEWQSLPWLFDNLTQGWHVAIDEWTQIALVGDQLWSATPAGLINVDRSRTGATLSVDSLVIVREPSVGEQLCAVTEFMQHEDATFVRCDFASDLVFQGNLSLGKDEKVFTSSDRDPFAEQLMVDATTSSYWNWNMVGRNGRGQPGRLTATLHGEEVGLPGGRFTFDTLTSLALFSTDTIAIGTETGGWFEGPRDDLPVINMVRPQAKVDATIDHVGLTVVGDEMRLCLRTTDGDFVRLAADGTQEGTESCAEFMGADGLWRYSAENQQLTVEAPESIGGRGERLLANGRFNDTHIIGLPVAGFAPEAPRYWFPTQVGVLELDAAFEPVGLHVQPFAGIDPALLPTSLYMLDAMTPAYVGDQALYALNATREALTDNLLGTLPGGITVRSIGAGYGDFVRLQWESADKQRGWLSFDPAQPTTILPNGFSVDVSEFERYIERQVEWGVLSSSLTVQVEPTHVRIFFGFGSTPLDVPLSADFELVDALLIDTRLLLIGQRHLLDVDLESAMTTMMASE